MNNELLPTITLTFYSDPGHGWLQVPKKLIAEHRIDISCFSYEDREFVYLEEDCEAPRFTTELERSYRVIIKHEYLEEYPCFIRKLSNFGSLGA